MRPVFLVVGCLAALLSSGTQAQRVNKCVDANGKTSYSADPCPSSATASTVKTSPSPTPAPANAGKAAPTPEEAFQKRRLERQEADKQAAKSSADEQQAKQNCALARGTLAELEMGRVSRVDSSGERRFLDDNEVGAEKAKARAVIQQWCK